MSEEWLLYNYKDAKNPSAKASLIDEQDSYESLLEVIKEELEND